MLSKRAITLIGKTCINNEGLWLPLWMHLEDTAYMAEYLARNWLSRQARKSIGLEDGLLIKTAKFIGFVHDIGKATHYFQNKIRLHVPEASERLSELLASAKKNVNRSPLQHAEASEAILLSFYCRSGIASIAGAHHGSTAGLKVKGLIKTQSSYFWGSREKEWRALWNELLAWALRKSGFNDVTDLPWLSTQSQLLLSGLLIMADWIASNVEYFPLLPVDELGSEEFYPGRGRAARDILDLTSPWQSDYMSLNDEMFKSEFGFFPNTVQQAAVEAAQKAALPGLFILEAQMGAGKTEAALAAAQIIARRTGSGGLYFGLPTQVTANGIFPRLEDWARTQSEDMKHSVRLAHAQAMLNNDYTSLFKGESVSDDENDSGIVAHSWFRGNKQALLADFVIATVDQLLMLALKQKHVMLRHLGLAGKIVVVDECHAYDTYMNGYLDKALKWLGAYHVPVLLLSATLPPKRRAEMLAAYRNKRRVDFSAPWVACRDYPILTWTDGEDTCQRAIEYGTRKQEVKITPTNEDNIAYHLNSKLGEGGCAGVIVNTVKKAQRIARQLRESMQGYEVFLYHAQFVATDRVEKEKSILQRIGKKSTNVQRAKFIVVGTQVLEQSLDIDFDYLVSELCPMDLLLQRIGRLHRHPRQRPQPLLTAECAVLDTGSEAFDEGSCAVYDEWLLWRTRKLLPEKIVLPDDIPQLVQDTYDWETADVLAGDAASEARREKYILAQKKQKMRSQGYQITDPEPEAPSDWCQPTLDGWLDNDMSDGENAARAAVRDGDMGIEVLVMVKHADGSIHFLPWQENGAGIAADTPPNAGDAVKIARQRLRLPKALCASWNVERTIKELENLNREYLSAWQLSPMLRGELILLLDDELSASLCGCNLRYSRHDGLTYQVEK